MPPRRMLQVVAEDVAFPTLGAMLPGSDPARPDLSMLEMLDFGMDRILDGIEIFTRERARPSGRG